jgi:phosphoglycolate phosphatase-like HAD superfamily hydrolase
MTGPASIRLLILDFDGIVLESNGVKTEAFREVFSAYPDHLDAMMRYHDATPSAPRRAKFEHLVYERLGQPGNRVLVDDLLIRFSSRVRARLRTCALVPGALEFLDEFAQRVRTYLVSVTPEADLEATLADRDLRRHFAAVYGCPPWTKTTAVADILRASGEAADRAVLVGDSPSDLQAAGETGVEFVGRASDIPFPVHGVPLHKDMHGVAAFLRPRLLCR